jgi:hypothetical protein
MMTWFRPLWRSVAALAVLAGAVLLEFSLLHDRLSNDVHLLLDTVKPPAQAATPTGPSGIAPGPVPVPAPSAAGAVNGVDLRALNIHRNAARAGLPGRVILLSCTRTGVWVTRRREPGCKFRPVSGVAQPLHVTLPGSAKSAARHLPCPGHLRAAASLTSSSMRAKSFVAKASIHKRQEHSPLLRDTNGGQRYSRELAGATQLATTDEYT